MVYRLKISGKTDKGKKRDRNEDAFVVDDDLGFMAVADGMGGHAAGDVASRLGIQLCHEQLKRALKMGSVPVFKKTAAAGPLDPRTLLLGDCIKFANQAVYEAGQKTAANTNMGTTLVGAYLLGNKLAVAHVGDSRLYIVRDGDICLCTTDHSFVQDQINRGLIKPEDAEKSHFRNMLTRSVGVEANVEVDVREIDLQGGDHILLCSDGLTKMLDDEQIAMAFAEMAASDGVQGLSEELIRRANDAGGSDNVTVVVARVEVAATHTDGVKGMLRKAFS